MKFLNRILVALPLVFLSACEEKPAPVPAEKIRLELTDEKLEFSAAGGKETIGIKAPAKPSVVGLYDWCSWVNRAEGGNSYSLDITVKENAGAARSAEFSIICGDEKKKLTISQEGVDPLAFLETPGLPDNVATRLASELGIGWNLGNQMDAQVNGVASETAWGNQKTTQTCFDKLKALGFSTVRIPVTWLGHIGEAPEYRIDEAWLDRVAEIVGYAEKAGLKAIVNIHHDGADSKYWLDIAGAAVNSELQSQILAEITAVWGQIAAKFADKGDFLIFEAFNEIHDGNWGWGANRNDGGAQYRCLNEWNAAFVKAVRAAGGYNTERLLGVPAYCTNIDLAIESFVLPEDSVKDRLMLSVHCYDPGDYCLNAKKSQWGHTADASKKVAGDNEADLKASFDKLYEHYVSKGIPVYIGEFGCVNRSSAAEQAFQQYYLSFYAKLSALYGVPSMLWDNGAGGSGNESFGYINHSSGEFISDGSESAIKSIIDSYKSDATLKDIYTKAPENKQ